MRSLVPSRFATRKSTRCEKSGLDGAHTLVLDLARAAEGWLRKNPLDPSISIIRLWGVLVDYKPVRQRSWSRALVRHGADARAAIEAVLGVPVEKLC